MNVVITADIIDYTKLSDKQVTDVLDSIHNMFNEQKNVSGNVFRDFSIKRGDSIQGVIHNIPDALEVALKLKLAINKVEVDKGHKPIDVRIAMGLGELTERDSINESSGEAFINSGRTLDGMKKHKRIISWKSKYSKLDAEIETELKLLEVIMQSWTVRTSEILYWTLFGYDEKEIAKRLSKTQPAINQGKKRAGWNAVEALLTRFRDLLIEIKENKL
jgi:hypothetical protein